MANHIQEHRIHSTDTVEALCVLDKAGYIVSENYLRIDPITTYGSKEIDDVSTGNLMALKKDGQLSVIAYSKKLNSFIN